MKIIHDYPYQVTEIENIYIPLKDGTKLAARIWLPNIQSNEKIPAILEYLPYRKRDGTAVRDALTHPWFAGHGYACIRVDIRGNGESEGLMHDEYLLQEQLDALEVIDWITRQEWSNQKVGMMGISWGGFNGLQVAAHQPEALKAIITICSTDDRYRDDIHYKGGNLLCENMGWASTMLSFSAATPDPLLLPEKWRDMWLQRLDNMPLLTKNWLEHQTRDQYWQHGSICENYGNIKAAVLAIGAWGDAYRNTVSRMMEHLPGPKKAIIGPWIHKYPHFAVPAPAIDFLSEAKKWWDYWLKGIDNNVMAEPMCRYYLQDALPPQPSYTERPGFWAELNSWPNDAIEWTPFYLTDNAPASEALKPSTFPHFPDITEIPAKILSQTKRPLKIPQIIASPNTIGAHQGRYCAIWFGPDGPTDQRRDDGLSLTFDSAILNKPLSLLGNPKITLRLKNAKTCGQIFVRLNALAPDGSSQQISYGALNLAMKEDFSDIDPSWQEKERDITISLDHIGYNIPKGYQLRVALSTGSFPLLWPAKEQAEITLLEGLQTIWLPIFKGKMVENPFGEPQASQPVNLETIRESTPRRQIIEDVMTGRITTQINDDLGHVKFVDYNYEVDQTCEEIYSILPNDPLSASANITWNYQVSRDQWQVHVVSKMKVTADDHYFYIKASQLAYENLDRHDDTTKSLVHEKHWDEKVIRLS